MPALNFPASPATGTRYPLDPGTSGITQWVYTGTKWNVVPSFVSIGSPKQNAYNDYQWPSTAGSLKQQLTTDGAGILSWQPSAVPSIQVLGILPADLPFDGTKTAFTLVDSGTLAPYTPTPSSNIVVFLGGVPQTPSVAYSISGSTINFMEAPQLGATFYAITNVVV